MSTDKANYYLYMSILSISWLGCVSIEAVKFYFMFLKIEFSIHF